MLEEKVGRTWGLFRWGLIKEREESSMIPGFL